MARDGPDQLLDLTREHGDAIPDSGPRVVAACAMRLFRGRPDVVLSCVTTAATVLTCGAVLSAAILVPAPASVIWLIVIFCIGGPMLAAWDLSRAVAATRSSLDLDEMRRELDRLPETRHPLDP